MEVNFDKVICLDVMKYNDATLNELSDYFGLNGQAICNNKKKGVKKYYIYTELLDNTEGLDPIIAFEVKPGSVLSKNFYTYENLKLNATLTRRQINKLRELKSFDYIQYIKNKRREAHEEKQSLQTTENLNLDDILDKISKFGLDSLTSNEKDFLKDLN